MQHSYCRIFAFKRHTKNNRFLPPDWKSNRNMMKIYNTYLSVLSFAFIAVVSIQWVRASDDNCCGDTKYDPSTEECCGGTTVVPKGRCCNGQELEEGFECCNKLSPPLPYNPKTTCCTESALYAKGTALPLDINKCPDRVANPKYKPTYNGCGRPG